MSTSKKQIEANRQNAKKSTGPKTEEGKAASSQNAVKHGLYSHNIIINSPHFKEDPEEYRQLVDSLVDELKPESTIQRYVVLKIANCIWRSRRAIAAETAHITNQLSNIDDSVALRVYFKEKEARENDEDYEVSPEEINEIVSTLVGLKSIPGKHANSNILHYQMRLDRQIAQAYQLLNHLKKTRKRNCRNRQKGEPAKTEQKNTQNEPIS